METLELLHTQVSKLSDKVEQLTNQVGNIHSTCALRHNVDLISEINHVSWCVEDIKKRLQKQEQLNNQSKDVHDELDSSIDQIVTVLDSVKLRIAALEETANKKEQRKYTINSQIMITVVGAIILSILTGLGSMIWSHIVEPITNKPQKPSYHYSQQYPEKNPNSSENNFKK